MSDKELYDLYVEHIWSKAPDYFQDELSACEDVIIAGIKAILEIDRKRVFRQAGEPILCGVSAEGAAWAMEACPKCGSVATPIVSPLYHSASRACQRCGHVWVDALAEEQRGEFTETEPW